jgi:hypothetical protein
MSAGRFLHLQSKESLCYDDQVLEIAVNVITTVEDWASKRDNLLI